MLLWPADFKCEPVAGLLGLVEMDCWAPLQSFWLRRSGIDPRNDFYNKFPGDAAAAGHYTW